MARSLHCWIACVVVITSTAWAGQSIELSEGWRFAPDPDQQGLKAGWNTPDFDDSTWPMLNCGAPWEVQGFPDVNGVVWYRRRVDVPEAMRSEHVWLVLGAINDAGVIYCNGIQVGVFGNETTLTMAYDALAVDLAPAIRWGEANVFAIRVFDWGDTGGLTTKPCLLTTDPAALPRLLMQFVPALIGGPSIVGVELVSLGFGADADVGVSAAVNDTAAIQREAAIERDHEGRPIAVARFDLKPQADDRIALKTMIRGGDGADTVLERIYTWPAAPVWPGEYSKLRVLNNFVTELQSIPSVPKNFMQYRFLNPRDGWVFIQLDGNEAAIARLDDQTQPLLWRKHPETGDLEAMQHLGEGGHTLALEEAQGARLEIRAVPELAMCYWPPAATALAPLPDRDRAYAERHVFPNVNVLITHDNMTEDEFASWRAEGRRWINNASLIGLHKDIAPTADAVYENWVTNASVTRPGYSGVIVDEFLSSPVDHYAAWTTGLERLYAHPHFEGQSFYAWVVDTYRHEPGLAFMRRLYDLGGRFAWERYLLEQPTEEVGMLRIYKELGALAEWSKLMPEVKERLTFCLGSFTTPWCSLNIDPGINYIPFMDRQFQVLATDPMFFSARGIFHWAEHYTDDDVFRYSYALMRHYCIDGGRDLFRDFPYLLKHIANPDFAKGLVGWDVEPAENGAIVAGEYLGLGNLQGRWTELGVGDTYAAMVRSETGPNRISQVVQDLEPGRLYTLKFIAADMANLADNKEVGLWAEFDGADTVASGSFRTVIHSPNSTVGEFGRDHYAYLTYVQVMFRPAGATARLTFSDWKDGKPAGPVGQHVGFNFVEIQPYYE